MATAVGSSEGEMTVGVRRVLPLYAVVFVGFLGYSLMITLFTPLLLRPDGRMLASGDSSATRTIVLGVLLALYPLGQFVSAPIIGSLSDRHGRKPTLLVSLCASAACYALIALAVQSRTLGLLMIGCFLAGLAEANVAVAQSAVADIAPPQQRSRLFGYVYLSISLAYVVGPLGGGRLADKSLVGWFDYATPFWATIALLLAAVGLVAAEFRETAVRRSTEPLPLAAAFKSLGSAFAPGRLRALYLANFVLYLAIFGFFRVYPMYLVDHFHMSVARESVFVAWISVPIVAANLGIVAWLARRTTPLRTAAAGAAAMAVTMASIVVFGSENALWVTLGLTALAVAICLPAAAAIISGAATGAQQGQALGANQSLQVGAEALAGFVGGLLAAIATVLPLLAMAGLSALASTRFASSGPRPDRGCGRAARAGSR